MESLGITEEKRKALEKEILAMNRQGKSWRQIARMAFQKFNIRIKNPNYGKI